MLTIFAKDFKSGWKQFSGGGWATIVTPEHGGTAHPIRPDGSLCEPRALRRKERTTLESLQAHEADLNIIFDALKADWGRHAKSAFPSRCQ